jgi:signal peptidase I
LIHRILPESHLPGIARIACIVAFAMAAGVVVSALAGKIFLLPFALIPLIAGVGIMRSRVWSAYGLALFLFAQLLPVAFVVLRTRSRPPGTIGATGLAAVLIPLFFFAGRSLAADRKRSGLAWPWIALTALTTLPVLFAQVFVIPTGTMEDTLLIGDRVLVQRFPSPRPARGEMMVFIYPIDRRQTYVKRIIGMPGDRIRISRKTVYRNGAALAEPYAVHKTDYEDAYRDNFPSEPNLSLEQPAEEMLRKHVVNGEVVVPEGEYFVLGDNRDLSLDSRYWGFIGASDLIGRPLMIYDSEEQPAGNPSGGSRIRWGRIFKLL